MNLLRISCATFEPMFMRMKAIRSDDGNCTTPATYFFPGGEKCAPSLQVAVLVPRNECAYYPDTLLLWRENQIIR